MAAFLAALPADIDRESLEQLSVGYQSLVRLESMSSDDLRANFTLAHFLTKEDAKRAINSTVIIRGKHYKAQQAYYVSIH